MFRIMEVPFETHVAINQWAEEDRPREKLLNQGRRALSDAELMAILIGSGSRNESAVELCRKILKKNDNDLYKLARLSVKELCTFKGIGPAKAIAIVAALELGRRRKDLPKVKRKYIGCSRDAYDILKAQYEDLNHEEFWVILMNQANQVQSTQLISKGGRAGTVVDAKIVFETALLHESAAIILTHNHPSGNFQPSDPDKVLTKKLVEAGRLLDIRVLDHLIFGEKNYYSFSDQGEM